MIKQNRRSFVDPLDFRTSIGFGDGPGSRERLGLRGNGPRIVVTDLGILRPDPDSCELTLTDLHPGVSVDAAREATGWALAVAPELKRTPAPTEAELAELRHLVSMRAEGSTK